MINPNELERLIQSIKDTGEGTMTINAETGQLETMKWTKKRDKPPEKGGDH